VLPVSKLHNVSARLSNDEYKMLSELVIKFNEESYSQVAQADVLRAGIIELYKKKLPKGTAISSNKKEVPVDAKIEAIEKQLEQYRQELIEANPEHSESRIERNVRVRRHKLYIDNGIDLEEESNPAE
jgi:hypothetical protein